MKFEVKNRYSGETQFTADIDCSEDAAQSVMLGLAVVWAIKNGANLTGADLTGADLYGANLTGANLTRADLTGANLYGANLTRADLAGANLAGADLTGADLTGANLTGADLYGAKLPKFQIPQEGELIVYKKLLGGLCKLRIPPEAKRTASLVGRKCRAEFAEVIEAPASCAVSTYDRKTKYIVGEMVRPDSYDPNPALECTNGIHFFLTKEEAEEY